MDMSAVSHDELIGEVQKRLSAGSLGYEGMLSRNQLDYRHCYQSLCDMVWDFSNQDFDNRFVRSLRAKIIELAESDNYQLPGRSDICGQHHVLWLPSSSRSRAKARGRMNNSLIVIIVVVLVVLLLMGRA